MNIKFLGYFSKNESPFWGWYPFFKYNFEIEYISEKDFEIYTKELRLNLKHQFGHNKIWREDETK